MSPRGVSVRARPKPIMSVGDPDGVVGHVARDRLAFALVDEGGALDVASIRSFAKEDQPTVSGGLSDFLRAAGTSPSLKRCALAVAGVARGDVVSITNSPWFVSRSGLAAMLGAPPIILNDFAARAWALADPSKAKVETFQGARPSMTQSEGSCCLIGIGLELGVAALVRDSSGVSRVIASEAGASILPSSQSLKSPAVERLHGSGDRIEAYKVLSGIGLARLAQAMRGGASPVKVTDLAAVRAVTNGRDASDREALNVFCELFWEFAANLTMTFGAWDGVLVTGEVAHMLRARLIDAARLGFARKGPHMRLLQAVPLSFVTVDHGELAGAAMALNAAGEP
jgi:glucokinase